MAAHRRLLVPLLIGAALLLPGAAGTAAATPFRAEVLLGGGCVSGTGPAGRGRLEVRTPGGRLRAGTALRAPTGSWSVCVGTSVLSGGIHGGDRLRVTIGSATRSWRVPRIALTIDRVAETIGGTIAPGASLTVDAPAVGPRHVTPDADGRFELALAGVADLRSGSTVEVRSTARGLTTEMLAFVPGLQLTAADPGVSGVGPAGRPVELRLVRDGVTRASARVDDLFLGFFFATLRDSSGNVAYPRPGDRLVSSIDGVRPLRIPASRLSGNAARDRLVGRCMARAPYELDILQRGPGGRPIGRSLSGVTDDAGRLVRSLAGRLDLKAGATLGLTCLYPEGDTFTRLGEAR
jgi:hypothetical protein